MPDVWTEWDERVKRTGVPTRVVADLTDLEILNLLVDSDPRRSMEKAILRQECYRRMGHPEALPPHKVLRQGGEPATRTYGPETFSALPALDDYVDPF